MLHLAHQKQEQQQQELPHACRVMVPCSPCAAGRARAASIWRAAAHGDAIAGQVAAAMVRVLLQGSMRSGSGPAGQRIHLLLQLLAAGLVVLQLLRTHGHLTWDSASAWLWPGVRRRAQRGAMDVAMAHGDAAHSFGPHLSKGLIALLLLDAEACLAPAQQLHTIMHRMRHNCWLACSLMTPHKQGKARLSTGQSAGLHIPARQCLLRGGSS